MCARSSCGAIFEHFVAAERQADLDAAHEQITNRPVVETGLPRTPRQRRFDALVAIFQAAASAPLADGESTLDVVVDLGRSARLFRGSARAAALLQDRRCIWPGCGRTNDLQIDHTAEWQRDDGPTSPHNSAPLCGVHNRWKYLHRYQPRRDAAGRWHLHRPDGSEVLAA